MPTVDVLETFRQTLAEVENKDFGHVREDTAVSDLGIDSVTMMEVLGCLEDDLDVRIPDEALNGLTTVGDVVRTIRKLLEP